VKCSYPECRRLIQGDLEEVLENGFGYCERGHINVLPGSTQLDSRCECGARRTNQPGHSWFCPESKKGFS
jgi:hypothetical protein